MTLTYRLQTNATIKNIMKSTLENFLVIDNFGDVISYDSFKNRTASASVIISEKPSMVHNK